MKVKPGKTSTSRAIQPPYRPLQLLPPAAARSMAARHAQLALSQCHPTSAALVDLSTPREPIAHRLLLTKNVLRAGLNVPRETPRLPPSCSANAQIPCTSLGHARGTTSPKRNAVKLPLVHARPRNDLASLLDKAHPVHRLPILPPEVWHTRSGG